MILEMRTDGAAAARRGLQGRSPTAVRPAARALVQELPSRRIEVVEAAFAYGVFMIASEMSGLAHTAILQQQYKRAGPIGLRLLRVIPGEILR